MSNSIVTLDTRGVIDDPLTKLQWILTYLVSTETSQTNAHSNLIFSLPDAIRRHGDNEVGLRDEVQSRLQGVFERYFDSVNVDVSTNDLPNDPSKFEIVIRARVLQNNQWYDLAHSLYVIRDKLELVTEVTSKY